MQKKLYFLNEEEKNRILNLHESRTKRQYLINEVSGILGSLGYYGSSSTDLKTKFFDNRKNRAQTLDDICTKKKFGAQENEKSKEFITWFNNQYSQNKSASEKTNAWDKLPNILSKFKTTDEFCRLNSDIRDNQLVTTDAKKELAKTTGIAGWLYQNIAYQNSWIKYFEEPLKNVLESAGMETIDSVDKVKAGSGEKSDKTSWKNYPCVTKKGVDVTLKYKGIKSNWKKIDRGDKGIYYYNSEGKYYNNKENKLKDYECGFDGKVYDKGFAPKPTSGGSGESFAQDGIGRTTRSVSNQIPT